MNATGTFLCTQAVVPGMVEREWGRVVNIASVAALAPTPGMVHYNAAKAGLAAAKGKNAAPTSWR